MVWLIATRSLGQDAPQAVDPTDLPGVALETSVGFVLGQQDLGGTAWGPVGSRSGALTAPFARHPFDTVLVSGLHIEERLIWNQIRLGVGYQRLFPSYDFQSTTRSYPVDGVQRDVAVEGLAIHEVRFTIGGLAPLEPVAPYVDIAGDIRELRATLSVDGVREVHRSAGFGLSVIGGLRAETSEHTFLAFQGEYGLTGTMFWGVQAIAGFSVL